MALFELNIYGADDEIIKRFETDHVRFGVYLQATKFAEEIENANAVEKFKSIGTFVKKIFPDLTDDDLENADFNDVLNTFSQIVKKANGITSDDPKNA